MPATLPRQPTIIDLARAAGVSKSTVSAALLDDHRVSAETRQKVQQVAQKMGYIRNAFAANLATRGQMKPVHSLDVAIVSHIPLRSFYEGYQFGAFKRRLDELGYRCHHFDLLHDQISCEKLKATLYNRGFCGILFDYIYESRTEIFSADWSPFSLVCNGRTYTQPPCDVVRSSPFEAVSLAWNEVRHAGYRRIGFIFPRHRPVMLDDSEREAALWICQQKLQPGEQAIPPCLGIDDRVLFQDWFHHHRPDVVIGFNSGHRYWLTDLGLRIPEDVAYANLQNSDSDQDVAGVDPCRTETHIKAAEHLDFLVRHKRTGYPEKPWELLGPVRWVSGKTLPIKSAAGEVPRAT